MQHILYHGLKDNRLENLVVLNDVRHQVSHKHTGMFWEVLYEFHIRIVFFLSLYFSASLHSALKLFVQH